MASFIFTNNASSTLASGVTTTDTSIFLKAGDGALFPNPGAGEQFPITLKDAAGNLEICYCTSRTTDTLTVVRAQEGTTAIAFASGDVVEHRITSGVLADFYNYANGVIEPNTRMVFHQTNAPTGWTKDTTINDVALRVVSGVAGSGGTTPMTTVFSRTATDGHALSVAELAPHTHGVYEYTASGTFRFNGNTDLSNGTTGQTLSTGSGAPHTHPLTNFDLQYQDVIIATRN